jgi:hypothetical protein
MVQRFRFIPATGLKSDQSDQNRNFDGVRSATKSPRHQDINIYHPFVSLSLGGKIVISNEVHTSICVSIYYLESFLVDVLTQMINRKKGGTHEKRTHQLRNAD